VDGKAPNQEGETEKDSWNGDPMDTRKEIGGSMGKLGQGQTAKRKTTPRQGEDQSREKKMLIKSGVLRGECGEP